MNIFKESKLFVEFAVPAYMYCFNQTSIYVYRYLALWKDDRKNETNFQQHKYSYDAYHAIKLTLHHRSLYKELLLF